MVESRVKEIARSIPGKLAPGAVGAMRAGSQSDHEYARLGITKSRDRLAPVFLVLVVAAFFP